MKLVYISPNAYQITKFISNLCNNNYELTDSPLISYSKHITVIFKISKDNKDLIADMFWILSSKMVYRKLIETMDNYYISMNMYELLELVLSVKYNSFIDSIENLCRNYYPFSNNRKSKYFNSERLDYNIPYNYTLDFHILSDTRYIVSDYMNILINNDDLSRESLNELYTITFRLKATIRDEKIILKHNLIIDSPDKCNLYRGCLLFKRPENDKELLVSINHKHSEDKIGSEILSLSKEKLLKFIGEYAGRTKINCKEIIPNNTLTDVICTISIHDFIRLSLDPELCMILDGLNFLINYVAKMNEVILSGTKLP